MTQSNSDDFHSVSDVRLTAKLPVVRSLLSSIIIGFLALANVVAMMAFAAIPAVLLIVFMLSLGNSESSDLQTAYLVIQALTLPLSVLGNWRFFATFRWQTLKRLAGYTFLSLVSPTLFVVAGRFGSSLF